MIIFNNITVEKALSSQRNQQYLHLFPVQTPLLEPPLSLPSDITSFSSSPTTFQTDSSKGLLFHLSTYSPQIASLASASPRLLLLVRWNPCCHYPSFVSCLQADSGVRTTTSVTRQRQNPRQSSGISQTLGNRDMTARVLSDHYSLPPQTTVWPMSDLDSDVRQNRRLIV